MENTLVLPSSVRNASAGGTEMKQNRIKPFPFPIFVLAAFFVFSLVQGLVIGRDFPEPTKDTRQTETVEKGIVILVEFPDVTHNIDRNLVQTRFSQQLNNYVKEMSYGKVSLDIDVTKRWYKMPNSVRQYKISSRNLEVDKSRVKKLIEDALDAADKEVDFSRYSFAVIFMGAKVTDYGMIGLCGYPGMLGWSSQDVLKTRSGQRVRGGAAIFCYQAHLGTLFHDIAHILGGVKADKRMVPCLYDHDLQAKPGPMRETAIDAMINMGFWDPMSCHFYKREVPPPGISSWTRMRLNWIDQSKIKVVKPGQRAELVLGPLEDGSSEVLVVKIPLSAATYYLIENRQPIGCDKYLPGSGVLIMYADDSIAECRHGRAPVKLMDADASIQHLEGAAFDIGKRDSFRDEKNKIAIQLEQKIGGSYRILISPL
jgi:M6 family metalloprotease-like protein